MLGHNFGFRSVKEKRLLGSRTAKKSVTHMHVASDTDLMTKRNI